MSDKSALLGGSSYPSGLNSGEVSPLVKILGASITLLAVAAAVFDFIVVRGAGAWWHGRGGRDHTGWRGQRAVCLVLADVIVM